MTDIATELRGRWSWIVTIGFCLMVVGIIAMANAGMTSVVSALFFGWILVVGGAIRCAHAIADRRNGRMVLHLVAGEISIIVGAILLRRPMAGASTFTAILAIYFIIIALFRFATAMTMGNVPGRLWVAFDALTSLVLGILIFAHWPESTLWVFGLFIGIRIAVTGITQIALGLLVRTLPSQPSAS